MWYQIKSTRIIITDIDFLRQQMPASAYSLVIENIGLHFCHKCLFVTLVRCHGCDCANDTIVIVTKDYVFVSDNLDLVNRSSSTHAVSCENRPCSHHRNTLIIIASTHVI